MLTINMKSKIMKNCIIIAIVQLVCGFDAATVHTNELDALRRQMQVSLALFFVYFVFVISAYTLSIDEFRACAHSCNNGNWN